MPPAARAASNGAQDDSSAALKRRVKGLLNRLAEANLQGIAGEVAALMSQAGKRQVGDALTNELLRVTQLQKS